MVGAARRPKSVVAHVVGARPNFVKAAPVWRALAQLGVKQRLVHTGQHYDPELSAVFFRDLRLAPPDIQLDAPTDLEGALARLAPELVTVYGDVDSTLAAALAARSLEIPIAHVEAGLRSFDRSMPEEVNRIEVDKRSSLLFTTSPEAAENLATEGIDLASVHFVGNPMIDTLLASLEQLDSQAAAMTYGMSGAYAVATMHRQSNVDAAVDAARVVEALATVAARLPLLLPLHPRGRETLETAGLGDVAALTVLAPLGYLEFLSLVRGAALVVTDSGGVQEETTMLDVPCLTLRANTERPITISHGTNRLVSAEVLGTAVDAILSGGVHFPAERPPLWDGHAGERIAAQIQAWLRRRRDTSSMTSR